MDSQPSFSHKISAWHDIYNLVVEASVALSVADKSPIGEKLLDACNVLPFRVFSHEFRKSYVGNDNSSAESIIKTIFNCGKDLQFI